MNSRIVRSVWRQRLLGSIQGRLQLASFAAVFLGFSFASSASVWLNYRNLIQQHHRHASRVSTLMMSCLSESSHGGAGLNHSVRIPPERVQPCLNEYSGDDFFFWIQQSNGERLKPSTKVVQVPEGLMEAASRLLASRPFHDHALLREEGYATEVVNLDDRQYVVHLHEIGDMGAQVWTAENVTAAVMDDKNFFLLLIGVWGTALGLTAAGVGLLVSRIVRPLVQLNGMADLVTADNLNRLRIKLDDAPVELDQLANAFNRVLDRLADAWDHQRQFVDSVSHELRTPLTILSGYLKRALRRSDNLTEQQIQAIETAQDEAGRITRMVGDLLDVARSDGGRLAVSLEKICAVEIVRETVDAVKQSLGRRLKLAVPDESRICIEANRDRLKQVLINLLENAAKYSSSDSIIMIRVEVHSSTLSIKITDQGIGISEEDRPHVFDRFYRGANATDRQGSGLGLSVVKLLVEAMSGQIALTSEVGVGTTFVLTFPVCALPSLPISV